MIALSKRLMCVLGFSLSFGLLNQGYAQVEAPVEASAEAPVNNKQATAQPVPTQVLNHFEIKLQLSNPQWRILTKTQLRSLSNIAIAGAFNPKQVLGLVLVENLKDMTLNDYATALLENSPLKELLIESVSEVTFKEHSALRLVYSGDEANGRFRYLAYVFIHGQKGYQVVSGGPVAVVDENKLEYFATTVKLEATQASATSLSNDFTDEYGLTWRLKKGLFQDALSGLKLSTSKAWKALAGTPLSHINQEAVAGLVNQEAQVHMLFFDRPCPTTDTNLCKTWVSDELFQNLALQTLNEEYQYSYLGEKHNFQRLSHERGLYTYLYNIQLKSGRALQTLAWTLKPKASQDPNQTEVEFAQAWKDLSTGLKQVTLLSSSERSQVLQALKKLDDPQEFVSPHSSWMRGKYHHFSSGLTWQRPSGLWDVKVQPTKSDSNQELVMISSPRYGINAQIRIVDSYQLKATESHQYLWTELKQELSRTRGSCTKTSQGTRLVAQAKSHWSRCTFTRQLKQNQQAQQANTEIAWTYQLDSFRSHSSVIHLLTWGPQSLYEGMAEIVRENLEAQLKLSTPATTILTTDKSLIDERFRYRLKGLPAQGELRIHSQLKLGKAGSLIEYSTPKINIQSFALSQMASQQVAELIDRLAHNVQIDQPQQSKPADQPQATTKVNQVQRQVIWIGEHSAELLTWPNSVRGFKRSALLLSVPPVVYGVVAVGNEQEVSKLLTEQHLVLE